ncbi:MAG: hypothetical protein WDM78_18030 [Puia sp.]
MSWERTEPSPGFFTIKNNWFRKSKSGLYELYVEGRPFDRGVVNGKLSKELIQLQEDYFNDQINKMVPSKFYRHFLKYVIGCLTATWINMFRKKTRMRFMAFPCQLQTSMLISATTISVFSTITQRMILVMLCKTLRWWVVHRSAPGVQVGRQYDDHWKKF